MDRSLYPSYYDYIDKPDMVDETQVGADPAITYLGYWQTGPSVGDPLANANWKIKRVSVSAGITKTEYADGQQSFNKVWNDRAGYNYSFLK